MTTSLWGAGERDTVVAVLQRAVAQWPDRPFLDVLGETCTFGELDRETTRIAHGLKALGVGRGDTVVTVLDNNLDSAYLWFAINKLGAISVPVNTAYKGEFLGHQVSDAGAGVIVTESDYADRVLQVEDGLPEARVLIHRGAAPAGGSKRLQVLSLDAVKIDSNAPIDVQVQPSDLAMLVYTGGTTGPSKGCMVSHNYACNIARQSIRALGRTGDTVFWTPLPMFHMNAAATAVLAQMMLGARCVIYPRFSVSNFWADLERSGSNMASLLGSMIPLLAAAPDNEAMLRYKGKLLTVAAAPFPAGLKKVWAERFGVTTTLTPGFGLTECALITATEFRDDAPSDASGKRVPEFDVRILNDAGVEVPAGQSGEVVVRPLMPDVIFSGYWRRPADTLKVMKDLWFHTGDVGKFDEQGYFYFVDRKKDYLRRRGENISSFEMESTFRSHEAIEDLAVHAVLSDMTEDDVKVTLVLRPGAQLTEEALCHWAVDRLPYFAVPRYIEFRQVLPRNPVGRVLKYQLRDEGVTPATWDREKAGFKLKKR